ncbi:Uncharacterised protein [Segatella copri]|nr:Uncharacterised protein [Segatella copri]
MGKNKAFFYVSHRRIILVGFVSIGELLVKLELVLVAGYILGTLLDVVQTFLFYFYIMRTFFYGSIQLFVELAVVCFCV